MTEPDDEETGPIGGPIGTGLVTIATNRSLDTGAAGGEITTLLEDNGCEVVMQEHIDTEHDTIQSVVDRLVDRDDVDLVVTCGGTSIEPGDATLEAVEPLIDKEITAFSELFTTVAAREFGGRVIAARTLAGVIEEVPIFCLPASRDTVRLGLEEIVLPQARHLVTLAHGDVGATEPEEGDAGSW